MRIKCEKTLDRYRRRGLCELCRVPCSWLEPHHVWTRGAGGSDIDINLVALGQVFTSECNCHRKFHDGNERREAFIEIISRREKVIPRVIKDTIDFIRNHLGKNPSSEQIWAAIESLDDAQVRTLARKVLTQAGKIE